MSKLLLVYNAKSDILNSAFDFAHKIISPKTYNCNLCKLTHGNFGEKKEWIEFREKSNHDIEFLHIDEFEMTFPREQYPAVFKLENEVLTTMIDAEELNAMESMQGLVDKLTSIPQ